MRVNKAEFRRKYKMSLKALNMSFYFDHNATTPLSVVAREAWLEAVEKFWQNPSSLYPGGGAVARRLEDERENLAQLLGVDDTEDPGIVFTSGATEANNAIIAHFARASPAKYCALSSIEHPSVDAPASLHFGERLIKVPVSADGAISLAKLEQILAKGNVCLVSVMAANNETGVIQPCSEVSSLCRKYNALFHCDAVQWLGRYDATEIVALADIVVGSAHKFGGPKGTGFLRTGERARSLQLQSGGPQEQRRRAGTENLPGIAAMTRALEEATSNLSLWKQQREARDCFEATIVANLPGTSIIAENSQRLPNTSMLIMPSGRNLKWLTRLGQRGFSVSTGSACSSGSEDGSHVLTSMGLSPSEINRALRISSGLETAPDQWDALTRALNEVAEGINSGGPSAGKWIP
jgi:cysteine desulfurase